MTDQRHIQNPQSDQEKKIKAVVNTFILSGTLAFSFVFLAFIVHHSWGKDAWIAAIAQDHFAATIGLPLAAIAALCICFLLKFTSGQIEFEAFGLKFRGASGPILLWIFCFLAIAEMIKLLW